ncbi:MAG: hypothetical protein PHY59_03460 [Methanobacterium sp.]|nr:hypothetical protein [Methanobacterium sp.]
MEFKYLNNDIKRVEKKLEQLNQQYLEIEYQKELDKIEERCKEIKNRSDNNLKAEIWAEIYQDVLTLEKKSDKYKNLKKSKKLK